MERNVRVNDKFRHILKGCNFPYNERNFICAVILFPELQLLPNPHAYFLGLVVVYLM